jgi:hypothetical protein
MLAMGAIKINNPTLPQKRGKGRAPSGSAKNSGVKFPALGVSNPTKIIAIR